MGFFTCQQCSSYCYNKYSYTNKPTKFCSKACYTEWQKTHDAGGRIQKGHKMNYEANIGDITVRRERNGIDRQYIKTQDGWTKYYIWLWIEHFGQIIPGDIVHHLNGQHQDDRIENLLALPKGDHVHWHNRWYIKSIDQDWMNIYMRRYTNPMLGLC